MMMIHDSLKILYALLLLVLYDAGSILGEVKCIEKERQALLNFQHGLNDAWGMLSTWREDHSNGDCCKWEGIECNNETGQVLKLNLQATSWDTRYLIGRIDISLLIDLQNLEYLDLSGNDFEGSIPELVGSFLKLRYLNLKYSELGGRIPRQLGNISQLEYLNINDNYLYGAIPPQLGKLARLQYLDFGNNYLHGGIPYQLRNLGQLQHLNFAGHNSLSGVIPFHTGDFPMLQSLRLNGEFDLKTKDAEWLSNLSSLTNLELSSMRLGYSHYWLQMISKHIPNLTELKLPNCSLSDDDIRSLFDSHSNFSISLTILDLSYNVLTSSTVQMLFNLSSKLEDLSLQNCSLKDRSFLMSTSSASITNSPSSLGLIDLSYNLLKSSAIFHWLSNITTNIHTLFLNDNLLEGQIPDGFGKAMNSLESLDLSDNKLQGEVPHSFRNICTLNSLHLSSNDLGGDISSFIQNSSWCNRHTLYELLLASNRFTGTVPKSIRLLSELRSLRLNDNLLEGDVTESHLTKFTKLKYLELSHNSLSLKIDPNWVPPFQLRTLGLASCKLSPSFPSWLHTQRRLVYLDISNAGINDSVPEWFWNKLQHFEEVLDMSHNNFVGPIPNLPIKLPYGASIFLNSNQFEGAVPLFLRQTTTLFLYENKISDLSSFLSDDNNTTANLDTLDLSNNQITGQLPDSWEPLNSLLFLDLSNNDLSGRIPLSMGALIRLKALVLRNNNLIGELPSTLKNCSNLILLDVGKNLLSGPIPSWIGENLQQLIILSIQGNRFSGNLPKHLCYLRNIHLLDLSRNNLSNGIPTCIKDFVVLSRKRINANETLSHVYQDNITYFEIDGIYHYDDYRLNITLMWKGVESGFKNPELLLNSIDLSSNHLTGEIPKEFGYLVGLVSLNLSRNNLSGEIPDEIGNLTSLDFLDLSKNCLSGRIPSTLSQIDDLGVLDLSNNSLSGRIPSGRHMETFGASSFEGNVDLCGEQLNKTCPEDMIPLKPQGPATPDDGDDGDNSAFYQTLYMSMGFGFLTGFWCFLGPILLWRPWRNAYIIFLNKVVDYIYVMVAVNMAKCHKLLKN